ncbi:alpha/beta hydrolase [Actinoplanes couchii]|uniref:alpha/beta hydrolase n=1 Tax=Actinoplanes couchii TaxID=403638 RepID=UPI001942224B|nr:alpha/beta hydrolase [Actinoplanes couchii]MDR6322281.1 acetyl esterase/lipase [Actinoplanes couchii]
MIDAIVAEHPGFRPLTLDLFRPAGPGPSPLVIWVHGGAWRFGSNKHDGPQLAPAGIGHRILAEGYALARVTYRLSGEATFPAQLDDVKAGVRWLRRNAADLGLDERRFAIWGESAGGHLASLVTLTGEDPAEAVRAGVIWYGPSDLLTMATQNHPEGLQDHDSPESPESRLVGGPVQEMAKEAAAASPVHYVSPDAPPMLIVHGDQDRVVPAGQSRELYGRLTAVGAPAELRIVPGADHCFVGADLGPLVREGLDFLNRVLSVSAG